MANEGVSHSEAKTICDRLEISPSQRDASGNYGGKPNLNPTAKNGGSASVDKATSEFKLTDRGRPLPNFKGQFARRPQDV